MSTIHTQHSPPVQQSLLGFMRATHSVATPHRISAIARIVNPSIVYLQLEPVPQDSLMQDAVKASGEDEGRQQLVDQRDEDEGPDAGLAGL